MTTKRNMESSPERRGGWTPVDKMPEDEWQLTLLAITTDIEDGTPVRTAIEAARFKWTSAKAWLYASDIKPTERIQALREGVAVAKACATRDVMKAVHENAKSGNGQATAAWLQTCWPRGIDEDGGIPARSIMWTVDEDAIIAALSDPVSAAEPTEAVVGA